MSKPVKVEISSHELAECFKQAFDRVATKIASSMTLKERQVAFPMFVDMETEIFLGVLGNIAAYAIEVRENNPGKAVLFAEQAVNHLADLAHKDAPPDQGLINGFHPNSLN